MWPQVVSVASEGRDLSPTEIFDDTTNLRANFIQHSWSGYENQWHGTRLCYAVPVHESNRPYRNKSAPPHKLEYSPDVTSLIVVKQVNDLFQDTVDYWNYCFTKK